MQEAGWFWTIRGILSDVGTMMSKKPLPWWQVPSIIAASVAGLAALGTGIVTASRFLTLPERVEAGEAKNATQDKQLDRLITLQEYYQQQQVNQAAPAAPRSRTFNDHRQAEETRPWVEVDEEGWAWCCFEATEADCDEHETWEVCE